MVDQRTRCTAPEPVARAASGDRRRRTRTRVINSQIQATRRSRRPIRRSTATRRSYHSLGYHYPDLGHGGDSYCSRRWAGRRGIPSTISYGRTHRL